MGERTNGVPAASNAATRFSQRLKQGMARKGLKQADLIRMASQRGAKLGKSQVSQYVSGKTLPRADVAALLSELLEVSTPWLMGESGGPAVGPAEPTDLSASAAALAASASIASARAAARPAAAISSSVNPSALTSAVSERTTPMSQRMFTKSSKLDNVLYDVRGPVVDEAARLESEGAHILKLNIGNPAPFGFRTPFEVIQDMREQLPECEGYSDSRGLFSARKAIMQYAQVKGLPNVSMDGIYTGNGVSELINLCMQALLDTGDEILIPAPDYPLWTACATLSGGTPVHYRCDEQADWNPDLADMEAKVTPRTKAIVIINPNNPTGAVYSEGIA